MSLVLLRGGSESQWSATNPVLASREVGVVPAGAMKVGDGVTDWLSLPWVGDRGDTTQVADGGDSTTTVWAEGWDGGGDLTAGADGGFSATGLWDTSWDSGDATTASWSFTATGGVSLGTTVPTVPDQTITGGDATTQWGLLDTVRTLASTAADYVVSEFDHVVLASGNITLHLPRVADTTTGREFVVKNVGVGSVTVDAYGTEHVEGTETQVLLAGEALTVINTGTDWIVV